MILRRRAEAQAALAGRFWARRSKSGDVFDQEKPSAQNRVGGFSVTK